MGVRRRVALTVVLTVVQAVAARALLTAVRLPV
jgi:hypothetical protein